MTKAKQLIQKLKLNEPKKHSVRYDAVSTDGFVSSIYINKTALGGEVPEWITLTLELK